MTGRRHQPWHDRARAMKAEGATHLEISLAVERSLTTVAMLFSDTYRENQLAAHRRLRNERYRTDPDFRARELHRQKLIRVYRSEDRP